MKINIFLKIVIIILISFTVIFIFLIFYSGPGGRTGEPAFGLENAKNYACEILTRDCNNISTDSILIKNFDANKNDLINDDGDTLFALCQNWYGINTDSECKTKICECPHS